MPRRFRSARSDSSERPPTMRGFIDASGFGWMFGLGKAAVRLALTAASVWLPCHIVMKTSTGVFQQFKVAAAPAPDTSAPTVAATWPTKAPLPALSPDWGKLADAALDACEQWQQRATELATQRQLTADLPPPGSSSYWQDGIMLLDDRERFACYDAEGKAWRARALALEALPLLPSLLAQSASSPARTSTVNGLPSDEEIAAQARANAATYALPGASHPTTTRTPWVDPVSKTQHVRSYTR